jgi:hypothetical protein
VIEVAREKQREKQLMREGEEPGEWDGSVLSFCVLRSAVCVVLCLSCSVFCVLVSVFCVSLCSVLCVLLLQPALNDSILETSRSSLTPQRYTPRHHQDAKSASRWR